MNVPKVSVLMPVYKTKPQFLKEAISSIISQSYKDFELIIVDDCPEDSRENIVSQYSDQRIRYYKNEHNLGISASRNKLLDLACGEYLAVFDHDNISDVRRLELEAGYLDKHPDVGVVSSQVEFFPGYRVTAFPSDNYSIKQHLVFENCVPHTALMLRSSVLREHGIRYESDYSPCEDFMLCLRLMRYTMFYNFPDILVKCRFYPENVSNTRYELMHDRGSLCRSYAERHYSYFYRREYDAKYWIKLFDLLPIFKVKRYQNKSMVYLFGFLPVLSMANIKRYYKPKDANKIGGGGKLNSKNILKHK